MSRYLTPSKIGLLALTSLYSESVVPSTAIIPVLSFLVASTGYTVSDSAVSPERHRLAANIDTLQKATANLVSGIPGRTIWDLLLNKLWKINSLDAFHVFFGTLEAMLQRLPDELERPSTDEIDDNPNRLLFSRVSPLGAFVRRAQIEFTRLQFHDALSIWQGFIAYRAPTFTQWKKRNPSAGPLSFDINLQNEGLHTETRTTKLMYGYRDDITKKSMLVSTVDVEKLLDYQVERMQHIGGRLPQEIKSRLRALIDTGVSVPSLSYYVQFLDAWRAGDYTASFDNLHRYFDYTMHNRDRALYQYALLNLAILHADFDCNSEALTAMEETIAAARENNDSGCLNYSLSWLYHFGKAHPTLMKEIQKKGMLGPEKEAVLFMKAKAKETGMWSLLITSLLSEAKLALSQGGSVSLALENVLKASHIIMTRDIQTGVGSQMMMHSSILGRLGISSQAFLTNEIFLQCYSKQAPAEDSLHCVTQNASMLAQRGRYEDALGRMESDRQDVSRPLRHQQMWSAQLGIMKLRRHLFKGNLTAADHVFAQLQARPGWGREEYTEIKILEIDLKMRRRDFSSAMECLEKLAKQLDEQEADVYCRIKVMTLKSRIYDSARVPQKGLSVAIRAASLALKSRLLASLWDAINAICAICNSLSEFAASMRLLESIAPQVLECEDCGLAAQTFSLLADSHMGLAGQAKVGSKGRKEQLTKSLENLGRAFDEFSQIEDVRGQCEMMAKKATIMHLNGDLVLANDCASKYLAIKDAAKQEA